MKFLKKYWTLLKATFQDWTEDKAPRLAAALAYYTVFSLAPLLVLAIAIAGFVMGNNDVIRQQVIQQVQGLVGAQAADTVNGLISQTNQNGTGVIATIVSIVTLIFGATGLFGQLQDALNTIWEVKPKPNRGIMGIIKDRFLSFTMVLGTSFLLLVSLVISAMLAVMNDFVSGVIGAGFVAQALNFIVSIGIVTLIFALIFRILPDAEIAWGDVWVGAFVSAVLFSIGKLVIGLYLGNNAAASAYGAAGSLIVLLLWVYYSAQILFFGAEFTQVYARMFGSREVQPSKNAVRIDESERFNQGMKPKSSKDPEKSAATASGVAPAPRPVEQGVIPVVGQPQFYGYTPNAPDRLVSGKSRVRYTPRNPNSVLPVLAAGLVAGVVSIGKIIRTIQGNAVEVEEPSFLKRQMAKRPDVKIPFVSRRRK